METSEPNWGNSDCIIYGVNSHRLEGLHILSYDYVVGCKNYHSGRWFATQTSLHWEWNLLKPTYLLDCISICTDMTICGPNQYFKRENNSNKLFWVLFVIFRISSIIQLIKLSRYSLYGYNLRLLDIQRSSN